MQIKFLLLDVNRKAKKILIFIMHLPSVIFLLYASFAFANWHKPLPGHRSLVGHGGLVARQVDGGGPNCTEDSTCGECFGAGNVLCNNAGCFDPSEGQQCCKDGCRLEDFYFYFL
jgi:hypothetical protein